jgi:serine/threonine-protein kinase
VSLPERIGRYRILGLLGQGAMGTVYRGRDEALERDVAVKVMSLGQADSEARTRFQREAKAAARLQHPNIITIYELGEHMGSPFMALELLEGLDLQRAIEAGIKPDPKLTLPVVLQVLAGLGHAHEAGIVHRDVKPSNVFLPRGRPAKVMDFGVARLAGGTTTAGSVVGTPNYMSPEQAMGGQVDGRSDLFSVGLILYELVTGEKAYRGDTVVALIFKIAHEDADLTLLPRGPQWDRLRKVLARALARKREERYPDARGMAAELAEALGDLGGSGDWTVASDLGLIVRRPAPGADRAAEPAVLVPSGSSAPPLPPATPASGRLRVAGVLGALSLVVLGLAGYVAWRRAPAAPPPAPTSLAPLSPAATPVATPTTTPAPRARPTSAAPLPPSGSAESPPPLAASVPAEAETTVPPGPAPAEARLDRANDFMERGRYNLALAEARAVLVRDPDNAEAKALAGDAEAAIVIEACVRNARAALNAGDREGALAEVRKGLAVNPSEGRLLALFREATQ